MKKHKFNYYFFKKVIPIPIYGGNFIILFSNDSKKVGDLVKVDYARVEYLYAHSFSAFLYGGKESFAICFNFWDTMPITIGTITHEVNHAGNRLMLAREFEPDWINDEAEAYLKAWMADQVELFMKKCNIV
jgi:hypothetical protein